MDTEHIEFTAHNIRLDNGSFTKPDLGYSMDADEWFVSARRLLDTVFPGDKNHYRLADLGCLEGGFAVEFARMGFQVLGIEVRQANIAACNYVKPNTNLPNMEFIKDDARNIAKYGLFDVVFCKGVLYHLGKPKEFLTTLSAVTTKLLILQTHFSTDTKNKEHRWFGIARKPLARVKKHILAFGIGRKLSAGVKKLSARVKRHNPEPAPKYHEFNLSELTENETLRGRWYTEFANDEAFSKRDSSKWASWDNRRSFWIQREYLLQAIYDVGFDVVLEQFDGLGPNIAESTLSGLYKAETYGAFIGIKTEKAPQNRVKW
jgi:2-polyprenyl-3-methyl-5-hydroxy-6-metoxy-1,4-benzoquinol methylase